MGLTKIVNIWLATAYVTFSIFIVFRNNNYSEKQKDITTKLCTDKNVRGVILGQFCSYNVPY